MANTRIIHKKEGIKDRVGDRGNRVARNGETNMGVENDFFSSYHHSTV